jgi:TolB-like protein
MMARTVFPLAICLAVLATLLATGDAEAQGNEVMAQFVSDPISFFFDLRAPEAIQCGQAVLKGQETLSNDQRANVLTTLATIYVSTGKTAPARASFLQLLSENPGADLPRPELLPPPVVRLFYSLRDSVLSATGGAPPSSITTLAVGEIENNSIVRGAYDLDRFARGLTQVITTDLQAVTPLKIVDRQRLAVLLKEIEMGQAGVIGDPETRVRFGKLTGAQSFLFGSIMQTDKKHIRLDLRWVQTETGEVLLSKGIAMSVRSSDDLFKLESKVLLELLVPEVETFLASGGKKQDLRGNVKSYLNEKKQQVKTVYLDLLLKSGEAIEAEDRGDYAAAAAAWKEVRDLNPADSGAGNRTRALQAYLDLGKQDSGR